METSAVPAYEMPDDGFRKAAITAVIEYMVGKQMFDPVTGKSLDAGTCAVIITGDDDVMMVGDPDYIRARLAEPDVCAELLQRWPDMRVLYRDKPRS